MQYNSDQELPLIRTQINVNTFANNFQFTLAVRAGGVVRSFVGCASTHASTFVDCAKTLVQRSSLNGQPIV